MKSIHEYKLKAFVLIFILISLPCFCQPNSKIHTTQKNIQTNQSRPFVKYTSGIRSVLEDSKGNTWIGSHSEGVCLIRNGKFKYFTIADGLSDNQVRNIYEDQHGLIWFECGRGLSFYDGQHITVYDQRNYDFKNKWSPTSNDLWFKGDLSTGYNAREEQPGVYQYDGNTLSFRKFPIAPKGGEENYFSVTTPFIKAKNGTLWFGTYGAVIGYTGSTFKIIDNTYLGLNEANAALHIRSIMEDRNGNLWIGNNGIGVFKYDGNKTIHFSKQQSIKKDDFNGNTLDRVFALGEDSKGNIWFGTVKSGLWKFDGISLTNFTKKDGFPSGQVWTIYKTINGTLWFCGANPSGIYKFNGKTFERVY
ncbi:ligand-binding sensor domain-containing protein [Zhouia amylolytica]|uniref:ligand-binding sensor domain-containing protein n=1 Tax=Zhouia amylolytica TaxID=376730 RepID=UPI0004B4FE62|nr:two-component regulator propeller domain-containing protein [Zhouia amylolytica]